MGWTASGVSLVAALVGAARIDVGTGVERAQSLDQPPDRLRQRLVGEIHVGERRIAADRRRLVQVEDRAHRRLGLARHVGVPDFAGRHLGLLIGMDDSDLGMALDLGPGRGMDQELAEQPAECLVLLDAHLLIAEEDHLMRHQRIVQFAHLAVRQRTGEIDAGDFRADGRGDLANLDRLVGHDPMIRRQPAICKPRCAAGRRGRWRPWKYRGSARRSRPGPARRSRTARRCRPARRASAGRGPAARPAHRCCRWRSRPPPGRGPCSTGWRSSRRRPSGRAGSPARHARCLPVHRARLARARSAFILRPPRGTAGLRSCCRRNPGGTTTRR